MIRKKKKRIRLFQLFAIFIATISVGIFFVNSAFSFGYAGTVNTTSVSSFSVNGLTATYSGTTGDKDGTIKAEYKNGAITASASTGKNGCSTYNPSTITLVIRATQDGTLTYSTSKSGGGTFTLPTGQASPLLMYTNDTIQFSITSKSGKQETSTLTINLSFSPIKNIDVTFDAASVGGSYTVRMDSESAATDTFPKTYLNKPSSTGYVVNAKPDTGYVLYCWQDVTNSITLSYDSSATLYPTETCTIIPQFIAEGLPRFLVGTKTFYDLNEANIYAKTNGHKIVLTESGTLAASDGPYTVSGGNTLLIPLDSEYKVYTSSTDILYNTYTTPSAYKTLTLGENASLTITGSSSLCVASKMSSKGQMGGTNGTPTGKHGLINTKSGSTITVSSSSSLSCFGYIIGSGSITVNSGCTVYECFQITGWRGGTATSNCYKYSFPFNQYYVQNIECKLYLKKGAIEQLFSSVNASGSARSLSAGFIGSNLSMFRFSSTAGNDDYICKYYDGQRDRLVIEVSGSAEISPMTVSGLPIIGSVSTEDYILPLMNNMTFNILSGTLSITQDVYMQPGCEVNIFAETKFIVREGTQLYLYDWDQWQGNNFAGNKDFHPIPYAYSKTKNRTTDDLFDARIHVAGIIHCKGNIFTSSSSDYTGGGADICSSLVGEYGGTIIFQGNTARTSTMYEMANNSTKTTVYFTVAQLMNENGSYYDLRNYLSNLSSEDATKEQSLDYSINNDGKGEWGGSVSHGTTFMMTFVDELYPEIVIGLRANTEEQFTFPTTESIIEILNTSFTEYENYDKAFRRGNNKILKWEVSGVFYKAGITTENAIDMLEGVSIYPYWGGWVTENSERKYLMENQVNTEEHFATGLYGCKRFDTGEFGIAKFDADGYFESSYTGVYQYRQTSEFVKGDEQYYYIENGFVLLNSGLIFRDTDGDDFYTPDSYFYVDEDNHIFRNGWFRIVKTNGLKNNDVEIAPGYYYFDEFGKMDLSKNLIKDTKPSYIDTTNKIAYSFYESANNNIVADNYGLFAYGNNLYYAGDGGHLVVNTTLYVSHEKINGCMIGNVTVSEGLYYFDEQGRMYDTNFILITNGAQA